MTPVKWVDGFYDAPEDVPTEMLEPDLEVIPTAVIPLADLEVWLKGERLTVSQCTTSAACREHNGTIDTLLAQVQAWRTGLIPKCASGSTEGEAP